MCENESWSNAWSMWRINADLFIMNAPFRWCFFCLISLSYYTSKKIIEKYSVVYYIERTIIGDATNRE